jgi:hypothetical protein
LIHPLRAVTLKPIFVFDPSSVEALALLIGGHGADIYSAAIHDSGQ